MIEGFFGMADLLKTLVIPDNTMMEENNIVVNGDVLVGNYAEIGYGMIARSIIVGEKVSIAGCLDASDDVRLDFWSNVKGNVSTKKDAYLGESVKINGKLIVYGDLDIGNDVSVDDGFEAKGWIVIRNPVSVIVYIILYLTELFRLGKSEEVEKFLSEIYEEEQVTDHTLIIPNRAKITYDTIQVPNNVIIGNDSRLVGNIRSSSVRLGKNTTLFGGIRVRDNIYIDKGSIIHGNLVSRGSVYVEKSAHILGKIEGGYIKVHEDAIVDGAMKAENGVMILKEDDEQEGWWDRK